MQASRTIFSALILLAGIASGSVFYRLHKAKPIMRTVLSQPIFSELWCSGQSDRNPLARLVVAKKFLWVIVTKSDLHVSPHFPFSLMFLPEALGLDHRVPGRSILDLRQGSSSVVVKYRHATGDEEHLKLWVDDIPALMSALAELRLMRKGDAAKSLGTDWHSLTQERKNSFVTS